jgi:hypothetical protein
MILIKIEKCGHCFYCIYRDIIEYRDNFLDNNREIIFLISPNPTVKSRNQANRYSQCCLVLLLNACSLHTRARL